MVRSLTLLSALALVGCEEKKSKMTLGNEGAAGDCALAFDGLADTEWLFLRANPDRTDTPDIKTRLKFKKAGDKLQAVYNVGSVADFYTYDCAVNGEELVCKESPKVRDWCQALLAGNATCDAAALRAIEPSLTDDEVAAGIKAAEENVAKYKDKPEWKQFLLNNNNLGNKLRGLLYAKVDKKRCRLMVTDMYMTIYNGKKVEDSNPAGTNAFVKNDQGDLLWESCTSRDDVKALPGDLPADLATVATQKTWGVGDTANFYYTAADVQAPVEGCSFSFDVWADGKPLQKGLTPAPDANGRPTFKYTTALTAPSPTGEGNVYTFVVTPTCTTPPAGFKAEKRVACAAVLVQ